MKRKVKWLQDGEKVRGIYCGKRFTGTVVSSRGLTVPPYQQMATVAIDVPFMLFGEMKETVTAFPETIYDGVIDFN
jgi:hypothetical protein